MTSEDRNPKHTPSTGFTNPGAIDLSDLQRLEGPESEVPGARSFMHDIIELFIKLTPDLHSRAMRAVEDGDGHSLARTCHKLRSQAAYFGAQRLVHVCSQLEEAGLAEDLRRAEDLMSGLEDELDRVNMALQPHRGQFSEGPPPPGGRE